MASVFDVLPFDGGWCVKIAETGEVLFFTARRRAIAEARILARAWPLSVKVRVHPLRPPPLERWASMPIDFDYPLGAPT